MKNLRPLGASYRSDVCRKNRDGDLGFTHEGSAMDGRTDGTEEENPLLPIIVGVRSFVHALSWGLLKAD